ncbi:MAG: hypothetical protein ACOX9E_16470, partial [Lentisphaeria bacterium]
MRYVWIGLCLLWSVAGVLRAQDVGTIAIASIGELQKIGNDAAYPLNGHYYLTQDIDASECAMWMGFQPIGSVDKPFTGVLDGRGYRITGLVVIAWNNLDYVGLFSYVGKAGRIQSLRLTEVRVAPEGMRPIAVAALVGYNAGAISSCHMSGTVHTDGYKNAGL